MPRLRYLDSAGQDLLDILGHITRESGSLAIGRQFVGLMQSSSDDARDLPPRGGDGRQARGWREGIQEFGA